MSYREQASLGGRNAQITASRYGLQRVVAREQKQNYLLDTLACGHQIADYNNRTDVKRRRCTYCPRID